MKLVVTYKSFLSRKIAHTVVVKDSSGMTFVLVDGLVVVVKVVVEVVVEVEMEVVVILANAIMCRCEMQVTGTPMPARHGMWQANLK